MGEGRGGEMEAGRDFSEKFRRLTSYRSVNSFVEYVQNPQ